MSDLRAALLFFHKARTYVHDAGLGSEVDLQRDAVAESFSEADFLRESAWVILCSGFKEVTVRRHFDFISLCFCDWECAGTIVASAQECRMSAIQVFRNAAKIDAIVDAATRVAAAGFEAVRLAIASDPIGTLRTFRFIGPITAFHLAKNLGFDVAKPDRHLVRLVRRFGFTDASHLCGSIGRAVGEKTRVVDLILWRYLADHAIRKQPKLAAARALVSNA
jgi:hypothetical protein